MEPNTLIYALNDFIAKLLIIDTIFIIIFLNFRGLLGNHIYVKIFLIYCYLDIMVARYIC